MNKTINTRQWSEAIFGGFSRGSHLCMCRGGSAIRICQPVAASVRRAGHGSNNRTSRRVLAIDLNFATRLEAGIKSGMNRYQAPAPLPAQIIGRQPLQKDSPTEEDLF